MEDTNVELMRKAERLIELRGYQREGVSLDEESIDIKASNPDSNETVMMHIVTKSKLKSGRVGVEKVGEAQQIVEEPDIDKVILFGKGFTNAARRDLREEEIEFFSQDQKVVSTLNQQELYSHILGCVNELCQITCGEVPQSEAACEGYSKEAIPCTLCNGNGKYLRTPRAYREQTCPVCGGLGSKENHYSCQIRLTSDNADFHFEHDWTRLLQHDLLFFLETLRSLKAKQEEAFSSSILLEVTPSAA